MSHKVSAVAEAAGITVRTLHHYDSIGLLVPQARSTAGYRQYKTADVERLQEILLLRELGFSLEQIRDLIDDPQSDRLSILRQQKQALQQRQERLAALLESVERAIAAVTEGRGMNEQELLGVFSGFDPEQHEKEVEERWGDTAAYRESKRRTKRYDAAAWKAIQVAERGIASDVAALLEEGSPAVSGAAADLAERHRLHIDTAYYPCDCSMHVALSDLYTSDPRFREYWDSVAPGLADYVREAIAANAMRSG